MLDRAKLYTEIARVSEDLFVSYSDEYAYARRIWDCIVSDEAFAERVKSQAWSLPVPGWSGCLDTSFTISTQLSEQYQILAVDGSQIYPDRHQGTACYLINIGLIFFGYNTRQSHAYLYSEPHVFSNIEDEPIKSSSTDTVNALREAYEFEAAYEYAHKHCKDPDGANIILFDGSLIFWHLESKPQNFKDAFIERYMRVLVGLYDIGVPYAAYVSFPRHREVSNLIRLAASNFELETCQEWHRIDHVTDVAIMSFFLQPGTRSLAFSYTGNLRSAYAQEVVPYFFYIHTGYEIARVEVPAWVAQNPAHCDFVASIILDQAHKGKGYPIALAEAHEQAVVKGPDRDFFYQLITKHSIQHNKRIEQSLKSMKKKSIGV